MAQRTPEERLTELKQKEERIKEAQRKLKHQISQEERKARTRRLIEIGASIESIAGKPIEKENLPKLIAVLKEREEKEQWLSKALAYTNAEPQKENPQTKLRAEGGK